MNWTECIWTIHSCRYEHLRFINSNFLSAYTHIFFL
jgi:hypothetical protein